MLEAHKGHIYKFNNGTLENDRYVLVVGNENRSTDRMCSILMLCPTGIGHDVVKVTIQGFDSPMFAHCGMVTYTKREFLLEEVGIIDPNKMFKVDRLIASELDILGDIVQKARFYENAYNELLSKVVVNSAETLCEIGREE